MATHPAAVKLKPVVRFREFPFGMVSDPSMLRVHGPGSPGSISKSSRLPALRLCPRRRDGGRPSRLVRSESQGQPNHQWSRRGRRDTHDRRHLARPAGLIHFVEKYNVRLPREFVDHAAKSGWCVDREAVARGIYDYDY